MPNLIKGHCGIVGSTSYWDPLGFRPPALRAAGETMFVPSGDSVPDLAGCTLLMVSRGRGPASERPLDARSLRGRVLVAESGMCGDVTLRSVGGVRATRCTFLPGKSYRA